MPRSAQLLTRGTKAGQTLCRNQMLLGPRGGYKADSSRPATYPSFILRSREHVPMKLFVAVVVVVLLATCWAAPAEGVRLDDGSMLTGESSAVHLFIYFSMLLLSAVTMACPLLQMVPQEGWRACRSCPPCPVPSVSQSACLSKCYQHAMAALKPLTLHRPSWSGTNQCMRACAMQC